MTENRSTGTTREGNSSKIFFGWWTVLITGMVSGLGHGFYGYGISVFFKDLAAELGIGRAMTSLATGIGRLEGGISSPVTGWLSDKYGPKWVVSIGTAIAGIGLILMYFIHAVWSYIVVWGVIVGVGLNIGLTLAVDKSINDWFLKKRGLAQGTKFALLGVMGVILMPIVTWLVTQFGWRLSCLIWGILLLICSPILLLFVKQKRPEVYGMYPDGIAPKPAKMSNDRISVTEVEEPDISFKQAVRSRTYWMICLAFSAQTVVVGAFNIHFVPFLTDIGFDRVTAASMMSLMLFCTIPARFLSGVFSDKVPRDRLQFLLVGVFILLAIGILSYLIFGGTISVYVLLVLFGISSGSSTPLFLVVSGRFFGRKAFGMIMGSSIALRAPLALVAPVFTGWVFDQTGSYRYAMMIFVILNLVAITMLFFTRPPQIPSE